MHNNGSTVVKQEGDARRELDTVPKTVVPVGQESTNEDAISKAYIVIPSIFLVLSILCVSAAIYLYFQRTIAGGLDTRTMYYIIGAGVIALACGVLSAWKLIAECTKGEENAA
ncbi:hypothetical protein, partial [Anaplasma phagocytophilum]|uniref:hypothetical protein n=1 Tax=Anaplasma phagocytophilum TaxID=948 RepID=UPI00201AF4A1